MSELVLITRPGGQDQGEHLLALAEWMGVRARKLTLDAPPALDRLIEEAGGRRLIVAISAAALVPAMSERKPGRNRIPAQSRVRSVASRLR